ncbi:hypothetical protein [Priestia koreensis]|uniref:Uncharacterized protein n=1 Tax=Priestia koreensis TaxID=284581 RepID=A0A0M0KNI2_9BACI|nr:hypothetical protein [Priestia koreensis]KOO40416.1 hypothetical protein AMD01_20950 [Priestia koreensis]
MKYKVEIYEDDDLGSLMIDVPDEIDLVVDLVLSDIQEDVSGLWLDAVNDVLSKKSSYEEVSGNVCIIRVEENITKIVFKFAEEGEEDHCFIETEELKKIFLLWDEAIEKKYGESD